jgi:hypothetical protein
MTMQDDPRASFPRNTCATCKWYRKKPGTNGMCVVRPPSVFPIQTQQGVIMHSTFPTVDKDADCGEWKAGIISS